jgi:AraC-like DNA-binding protein
VPTSDFPKRTLHPPPGYPSWMDDQGLPLIYLGWGRRDFARFPVPMHRDWGTNYYLLLRGQIVLTTADTQVIVRGPTALLLDANCAFGLSQERRHLVEILVWVWRGTPTAPELRPPEGGHIQLTLQPDRIASLLNLHLRCRDEVAVADASTPRSLLALRELVEVEILRASQQTPAVVDMRWRLAQAWMASNLAVHSPVPALCEYLRMSASTLHRFFIAQTRQSPGAYFRDLRMREAQRLIRSEGRQVKEVALHLGYRHANDLSRALSARRPAGRPPRS